MPGNVAAAVFCARDSSMNIQPEVINITAARITGHAAAADVSRGIPEWTPTGDLPPGIHVASWQEVETRLAWNPQRKRLLKGFRRACVLLHKAGCLRVLLGGSFITSKDLPSDFDAAWDEYGVNAERLNPVFWDIRRLVQRQRFGGEFMPARALESTALIPVIDFLQRTRDGRRKGIVGIRLSN